MKHSKVLLVLAAIATLALFILRLPAGEVSAVARYEYVTIRWDGKENTHIIRPGGQVDFIGAELRKARKPERADERSFYMNLAMNGLVKDGYEFAGMTSDEIVMKRTVAR